jgi:hypothetical protein
MNSPISDRHHSIAVSSGIYIVEFDVQSLQPENIQLFHPSSLRCKFLFSVFFQFFSHENETGGFCSIE